MSIQDVGAIITGLCENVAQGTKAADDLMKEAQECSLAMLEKIKRAVASREEFKKPSRPVTRRRAVKQESISISSVTSTVEESMNLDESVSRRTRAATRAIRESQMCASSSTTADVSTGRGRRKAAVKAIPVPAEVAEKRGTDDEMMPKRELRKRIKQEQISMVESSTASPVTAAEKQAKKPRTRRKPKPQPQNDVMSLCSETLEDESQFCRAAFLHSSPNPEKNDAVGSSTTRTLPAVEYSPLKTQSKEKVSAEECAAKEGETTRRREEGEGANLVAEEEEKRSGEETHVIADSERTKVLERKESVAEKPQDEKEVSSPEKNVEATREGPISETEKREEGEGVPEEVRPPPEETQKVADSERTKVLARPALIVDSTDEEEEEEKEERIKSPEKSVRTTRRALRSKTNIKEEAATPTVVEQGPDVTRDIPKTTKRTKPVLKSKVFDGEGNVILKANAAAGRAYKVEQEQAVRSPGKPSTAEEKPARKGKETKKASRRGSNEENEPLRKSPDAGGMQQESDIIDSSVAPEPERFTRSKAKQKKLNHENIPPKTGGLTLMARKSLKKAVRASLLQEEVKKAQGLAPGFTPNHVRGHLLAKIQSASKAREAVANLAKLKTPLSAMPNKNMIVLNAINSQSKIAVSVKSEQVSSAAKERRPPGLQVPCLVTPAKVMGLSALDGVARSANKNGIQVVAEKEHRLKMIQEKQEEAEVKRLEALKSRQNELKKRNEIKLKSAVKQRAKLEAEKQMNILQSEKEKEMKHRLLLEERNNKMKEEMRRKKILMEQRMAEIEERRKAEEEARLAKLKEMEAEQERQMLEKQRELERQERRAQDRIAEQKAREAYEQQLKMEKALAEKKKAAQAEAEAASTAAPKSWNYRARHADDLGLEDENSEDDSDCEEEEKDRPIPSWAKKVKDGSCATCKFDNRDMIAAYMMCHQKTPDIHKMFKMTPRKRIKRTSSAIWDTPS